jgi:hypothetical protein
MRSKDDVRSSIDCSKYFHMKNDGRNLGVLDVDVGREAVARAEYLSTARD